MGIDARIDVRCKIDEKLKRSISCPVCTYILEDPVSLFCCGGHLCSKCYEDTSNCPRCRKANFKAINGRLMRDVLSTIKLICPNSACQISLLYDDFQEHKKNCFALRDERCAECDQTISLSKFHKHFQCFQKMAEDKTALATQLIEAKEQIAMLTTELEEHAPSSGTRSKKRKTKEVEIMVEKRRKERAEDNEKKIELEKMRRELKAVGGAGHFHRNDKCSYHGGERSSMEENVTRNILKLLSLGETKFNVKFWGADWVDVTESEWKIKFRGGRSSYGGDGWHYLWIGKTEGRVPFKAVLEEVHESSGAVKNRAVITSEPDGQTETIKYKTNDKADRCFVRYNITLL